MPRSERSRLAVPDRSLGRDRTIALVLIAAVLVATASAWGFFREGENRDASSARRDEAREIRDRFAVSYAQTEAVLATASALVDSRTRRSPS